MLDNSVALTWCFEDEQTPQTLALLEEIGEAGAPAPMLWPLEALNALLVAERRGRLDADRRRLLAGFFQRAADLRRAAAAVKLKILGI